MDGKGMPVSGINTKYTIFFGKSSLEDTSSIDFLERMEGKKGGRRERERRNTDMTETH